LIAEETIRAIAESVRLSEVAGDYFPVKRMGGRYSALCPFHRERTPSFFINDERGTWHCFGCGAGGSLFRFVMEMDRISFPEAIRKLGQRAGIAVEEQETEADKRKKAMVAAVADANSTYFSLLLGNEGQEARQMLRERHFGKEICKSWDIGFASGNYQLIGHPAILTETGMTYERGKLRFTNRIMFGIRNESGCLVGFSGRTTDGHPAKYLNSPESSIFTKGKLLYGMDKAKRAVIDSGQVVLVEGQIDCIRCHLAGITNAVAPLGTGFTTHHGAAVRRLADSAVLVFDGDKAGLEAARKAFAGLVSLGVKVKGVFLPDGADPDSFILGGGDLKALIEASKSFPEALAEHHKDCEDKTTASSKVAGCLSALDDGIERDSLATRCAKILGVRASSLKKQIAFGGHKSIPTETRYGHQLGESERLLIAHVLLCGKYQTQQYDWSVLSDNPEIQAVIKADFKAGDPSSIARALSELDGSIEAAIHGIAKDDVAGLDVKAIYKSLLAEEVKKKTTMVDALPLLATLKKL